MKKLFTLVVLILLTFTSCSEKKEEPPAPPQKTLEEVAIEKLAGAQGTTYVLGPSDYIKRNLVDESQFYQGFSFRLQGANKTYTTSGASDLFEEAGSWEFVGTNFDKIRLTGSKPASKVDISYTKNGQELVLVFSIPTPSGGRVASLTGSYEIKLKGG
jgi:hypothetical protein